jgi:hypothetical protein
VPSPDSAVPLDQKLFSGENVKFAYTFFFSIVWAIEKNGKTGQLWFSMAVMSRGGHEEGLCSRLRSRNA